MGMPVYQTVVCGYLFLEAIRVFPESQQELSNPKVKCVSGVFVCIWLVALALPWLVPVRSKEAFAGPTIVLGVAWAALVVLYVVATRK